MPSEQRKKLNYKGKKCISLIKREKIIFVSIPAMVVDCRLFQRNDHQLLPRSSPPPLSAPLPLHLSLVLMAAGEDCHGMFTVFRFITALNMAIRVDKAAKYGAEWW